MRHSVHAEGQFLLWVLVKLLPHGERFGYHLALFNPLGLIVAAANYPEAKVNIQVGQKLHLHMSCVKRRNSPSVTIDPICDQTQTGTQMVVYVDVMRAYLHQVRFQMRMVALVQTQVLMAIPVPNMENRLIFSTMRLGRFLMVHSGIGLLV